MNAVESLTHHVALILDNDEPLYRRRLELVEAAREEARTRFQGRPNVAVSILADALKDLYEDVAVPDTDAEAVTLPLLELFSTALAHVDWRTLASGYLAEA